MGGLLTPEKEKVASSVNLDVSSSVPLYSQIAGSFLSAIREGRYRDGEKLPSEKEICDLYNVSRITARKAVQELADMGKVERKQGKGTFVVSGQVEIMAMALGGFGGFAAHYQGNSHAVIISKRFGNASEKEAAWLNIKAGDPIEELVRCLIFKGSPIMLDRALYSESRFPHLIDDLKDDDSTYALMKDKYSTTIHSVEKEISYTLARPHEASVLQCMVGEPLYFINKSVFDQEHKVIHHSISLAVASRVKLTLSYSRQFSGGPHE